MFPVANHTSREACFEFEQASFVLLDVHVSSFHRPRLSFNQWPLNDVKSSRLSESDASVPTSDRLLPHSAAHEAVRARDEVPEGVGTDARQPDEDTRVVDEVFFK